VHLPCTCLRNIAIHRSGIAVAYQEGMALMWDARSESSVELENTSSVAWRLHFAQLLAKSGFEPAVIKEAIVLNEALAGTTPEGDSFADAA